MPEVSEKGDSAPDVPNDSSQSVAQVVSLQRCPNCRARLSENTSCPRCGTDLSLPLQIAQDASSLQHVAMAYVLSEEWSLAKAALIDVQRLRRNEFSRQLLAFVDNQLMKSSNSPADHSVSAENMV